MKKQITSWLLVLVLCLGLTVPAAAAEEKVTVGDKAYETVLDAILSEKEDKPVTVALSGDVALTATVVLGESKVDDKTVTVASHNVTVDLNGYTLTGAKDSAVFEVQEGYTLTTPASGKVTANSDTTITATANAGTLSVKVEGHAAANPTSITANQAADITVTAEKGYTITDVTCAQAAKIKSNGDGTWTVSVPAGTEDIAIKVDTEAVSYTLNFAASGVWDFEVKDAKGQTVNDGDEVIVGETYTFKAIEKTASDTHNGAREFRVDGAAVCDAKLTAEGKNAVVKSVKVTASEADFKLAQKLAVVDGKLYTEEACQNEQSAAPNQETTLYYIESAAVKAVLEGEYTVVADDDGVLTLDIGQKR